MPPLFPTSNEGGVPLEIDSETERFTAMVGAMRPHADVFLVANVKDPALMKLDPVQTATMLREVLGVDAAPVLVVRDQNRPRFLSAALTGIHAELRWMMIAWGDDFPPSAKATNVRDYSSLAGAIRDAAAVRSRANSPTKFFAPVDIRTLASPAGVKVAKGRLRAGADMLLAQPPTTDNDAYASHTSLVERAGLKDRVLLNVFPFKDAQDIRRCEGMFGWRFSKKLHEAAAEGGEALSKLGSGVIRRLRSEGYPGVYVTARRDPKVPERLLS